MKKQNHTRNTNIRILYKKYMLQTVDDVISDDAKD